MKRYLLFSGDQDYPLGGWHDFDGSFDTPDEAKAAHVTPALFSGWAHIVDTATGARIEWKGAAPVGGRRTEEWALVTPLR